MDVKVIREKYCFFLCIFSLLFLSPLVSLLVVGAPAPSFVPPAALSSATAALSSAATAPPIVINNNYAPKQPSGSGGWFSALFARPRVVAAAVTAVSGVAFAAFRVISAYRFRHEVRDNFADLRAHVRTEMAALRKGQAKLREGQFHTNALVKNGFARVDADMAGIRCTVGENHASMQKALWSFREETTKADAGHAASFRYIESELALLKKRMAEKAEQDQEHHKQVSTQLLGVEKKQEATELLLSQSLAAQQQQAVALQQCGEQIVALKKGQKELRGLIEQLAQTVQQNHQESLKGQEGLRQESMAIQKTTGKILQGQDLWGQHITAQLQSLETVAASRLSSSSRSSVRSWPPALTFGHVVTSFGPGQSLAKN